jgi:hypothetical protein
MNIEKYNMVERQLICRGIREPQIIDSFLNVDREDFVPSRCKKFAYADIDISTNEDGTFMLRPYTLSRIVQRILHLRPERLLVVGEDTHYTTAILKCIFHGNGCSISEEDLLQGDVGNFDLVFFDSKIYSKTTIKHGKFMLGSLGKMIFFTYSSPSSFFNFSTQLSFIDVDIIEKTYDDIISILFSTSVFLRGR